jgi:hypothetical protein
MFKGLKHKTLAMICVFALLASYPITLSANVGTPAAFTFFGMSSTNVTAGQPINFTIRTTGANFVFADVGGVTVSGVMQGQPDHTGQVTWGLSISPMTTQTVLIYANAFHGLEGAAVISVPVTVGAAVAQQPQVPQAPQHPTHRIYSITEVDATRPNSVSLRIVTDDEAEHVWVVPEANRYLPASRVSGERNVWEINYVPRQFVPHQVQVNANRAYQIDQFIATENFTVNLTAPFVRQVQPNIGRASISPATINTGERSTISIRTNLDVEYVWAEVDGRRVDARRGTATTTNRNWTIDIRPERTQEVRVHANSTNTTQGAITETVRVTVRDEEPTIRSASIGSNHVWHGQGTRIDLQTNNEVRYVWAIVDGSRVNGRRDGGTGNNRNWIIDIHPTHNQTIRVYALSTDRERDGDSRTFSITVGNW